METEKNQAQLLTLWQHDYKPPSDAAVYCVPKPSLRYTPSASALHQPTYVDPFGNRSAPTVFGNFDTDMNVRTAYLKTPSVIKLRELRQWRFALSTEHTRLQLQRWCNEINLWWMHSLAHLPNLFWIVKLAPRDTKWFAQSLWPFHAARCRGVHPSEPA